LPTNGVLWVRLDGHERAAAMIVNCLWHFSLKKTERSDSVHNRLTRQPPHVEMKIRWVTMWRAGNVGAVLRDD
jgi:hypothetical protein